MKLVPDTFQLNFLSLACLQCMDVSTRLCRLHVAVLKRLSNQLLGIPYNFKTNNTYQHKTIVLRLQMMNRIYYTKSILP